MKPGRLRNFFLCYLSRPKADRVIYRAVRKFRPRSIVELGVGTARRTERLLELALAANLDSERPVRYMGIDLFEGRPDATGMSLKAAFKLLNGRGAKIQLAPGDPFSALARTANALTGTDLLIISADQDAESLSRAWSYMPRMLHEQSLIFLESGQLGRTRFQRLAFHEIESLAANSLAPAAKRAA